MGKIIILKAQNHNLIKLKNGEIEHLNNQTSIIYLVEHCYELYGNEDIKTIGIYSSESHAKEAINVLRQCEGFKDYPDGFITSKYELDKNYWNEGFISIKN